MLGDLLMDNKEFKKMFGEVAKNNGFERAFEGWFMQSDEVIHILELQKSNFSNSYYLNIKIYIQGALGNNYIISKELVKKDTGDIFLRPPDTYSRLFDLEFPLENEDRKNKLQDLFNQYIVPFIRNTKTKNKIKETYETGTFFILPAIKIFLGI